MRRLLCALLVLPAFLVTSCSQDADRSAAPSTTVASTRPEGAGGSTTEPDESSTPKPPPGPLADQTAPDTINGIAVQGDTIWVASIAGDVVLQVDRSNGAILARYDTEGAGPDDVAVAPDGSVYCTGFVSGVLGRIKDGSYRKVADVEPQINGIAVAPDGTVFAATIHMATPAADGALYRIDAGTGDVERVAEGLNLVNAFEYDRSTKTILAPAGPLESPRVVRIDPSNGKVDTVVKGLPIVQAVTWRPDGRLVALANVTGEILEIDMEAKTSEKVATVSEGAPFDNLSFATDGTLYLSSFTAPTITELRPDGTTRIIEIGKGTSG